MILNRYLYRRYVRRLEEAGFMIVDRRLLYDFQKNPSQSPSLIGSPLPPDASEYLVPANPRLIELRERYAAFDKAVTTPLDWTDDHVGPDDILYFRGDNAYLWQMRASTRTSWLMH